MAKINITISDELDREFRKAVAEYLGFKRGNLQIAIEEALEMWIKARKTVGAEVDLKRLIEEAIEEWIRRKKNERG